MSNSQNKKNEQQNNLCITLTEQWKKGELEDGFYYVEEDGKTFISICRKHYLLQVLQDCEVLAPVPSYVEWQQLHKFLEEFNALDVAKENKKLKEMLYKCREKLDWLNGGYVVWGGELTDFIEEIDNAIGEKK